MEKQLRAQLIKFGHNRARTKPTDGHFEQPTTWIQLVNSPLVFWWGVIEETEMKRMKLIKPVNSGGKMEPKPSQRLPYLLVFNGFHMFSSLESSNIPADHSHP